jgi:tripartite-type tricarboxylate transporter receptor subunit TctC
VVNKISQALANPNNQQKLVDGLRAQGIDVVITNPDQLKRLAAEDTVKWQKVISAAGINLK